MFKELFSESTISGKSNFDNLSAFTPYLECIPFINEAHYKEIKDRNTVCWILLL